MHVYNTITGVLDNSGGFNAGLRITAIEGILPYVQYETVKATEDPLMECTFTLQIKSVRQLSVNLEVLARELDLIGGVGDARDGFAGKMLVAPCAILAPINAGRHIICNLLAARQIIATNLEALMHFSSHKTHRGPMTTDPETAAALEAHATGSEEFNRIQAALIAALNLTSVDMSTSARLAQYISMSGVEESEAYRRISDMLGVPITSGDDEVSKIAHRMYAVKAAGTP